MILVLKRCQLRYPFELCFSSLMDLFLFSIRPFDMRLPFAGTNEFTISYFHLTSVFPKSIISLIWEFINSLLMMHIGHLTLLTESINKKLLVIKIVERSRSLKSKNYFWLYQIKDGIDEILKFGHRGIEDYLQIRRHQPYKQLKLNV